MANEALAKGTGNRSASWTPAVTNRHRMRVQLPHFKGGLGLTPAPAPAAGADNTEARAAAPLSLPPLNLLAKQHNLSEGEIGADCSLPPQSRVNKQVMRHRAPHVAAKDAPPNDRCKR